MMTLPPPILCLPIHPRLDEPRRYGVRWREDGQSRVVSKVTGEERPVSEWDFPERTIRRLSVERRHG